MDFLDYYFEDGIKFSFHKTRIPNAEKVYASTDEMMAIGRGRTLEEARYNAEKILLESKSFTLKHRSLSIKWKKKHRRLQEFE